MNVNRARILLSERVTQLLFEQRLHTRTEGRIELSDLGLPSEHRVQYQPSPWLTLPRTLRTSEIDERDVFLDLGCGMGRVLVEAAMLYRFRRVIGVELSPDLAAVAEENVRRNRGRFRVGSVEIVVSDVLDYVIPDDVTVVYLYNPFVGPIFWHVAQEIVASVDRAPRRLRIIYQNPDEEALLLATGRIRRVGFGRSFVRPGGRHPGLVTYEVDPPSASATAGWGQRQ
jgi:SAM-dependent methyltransferase